MTAFHGYACPEHNRQNRQYDKVHQEYLDSWITDSSETLVCRHAPDTCGKWHSCSVRRNDTIGETKVHFFQAACRLQPHFSLLSPS